VSPDSPSHHARKQSRSVAAECTNEIGASRNRDYFPSPDIPAEPDWPHPRLSDRISQSSRQARSFTAFLAPQGKIK